MATHRHKRETNARRTPKAAALAAPIAVFATLASVTTGVLMSDPAQDLVNANRASFTELTRDDETQVSRDSVDRAALERAATEKAIRKAHVRLWTTAPLNLWDSADKRAKLLGEIAAGKRVLVTGRRDNGRAEIVLEKKARWVTAEYLSKEKPIGPAAGLSMAPCPDSSVESGLTSDAVYLYRSVCHAFPQITSYGGWDNHGEHASGRALDIMTSDPALGDAIVAFLLNHAAELHLYDIIWQQRIWTADRSGEGFRFMSDRGSATANHYDHVHVAVY